MIACDAAKGGLFVGGLTAGVYGAGRAYNMVRAVQAERAMLQAAQETAAARGATGGSALGVAQLDANLLMRLSKGDPVAVAYANANRAAGLSYNYSTRFEFLAGGTRAELQLPEQQYGVGLLTKSPLPQIQKTAASLRGAFLDGRVLGYWDSQVAASAYLRGERLATGDLQFYKRAMDLSLNVEFVGSGNAAAKAANYVPRIVNVPLAR